MLRRFVASTIIALVLAAPPASTAAGPAGPNHTVIGIKVSAGARYDDVRMCVATDAGVKGGPAADVSFFVAFPLTNESELVVNIPVMRPLLFLLAFDMLQFEPDVTLAFRARGDDDVDLVGGPVLGVSLHYGPDYRSKASGDGRLASFFAIGPRIGGYLGVDFVRPGESFNFQLGLTPYFTPLWGIDDPASHRGFVLGGALEGHLRFQ